MPRFSTTGIESPSTLNTAIKILAVEQELAELTLVWQWNTDPLQ